MYEENDEYIFIGVDALINQQHEEIPLVSMWVYFV